MAYNPGTGPYNNPQITISTPLLSPPQQLTSADGTIQGSIDGVNSVFTWQVYFQMIDLYRNGIYQTCGLDYGVGPTAVAFMTGSIPQVGDVLTIAGYGTI